MPKSSTRRYNAVVTPVPPALVAALGDGIARLDADGGVHAVNAAMHEVLAIAGGGVPVAVQQLGGDGDTLACLLAGETVDLHVAGRSWRARSVTADGVRWLVLRETTAEERAASAAIEMVRLRVLAAAVGSLVHDFNNHLNAALGLASLVRPSLVDPRDVQVLDSLVVGTQQGAQLARSIVRLLTRTTGERSVVPASTVVGEATSIAAKAATQRSVTLEVETATTDPVVRTVVAEAVQALWQGILAVLERGPRRITITLDTMAQPCGSARVRALARVRLAIVGLAPQVMEELTLLVRGGPGVSNALGRSPMASSLATAALVQRRLGGDLLATTVGEQLQLDYLLPAVG